MKKMLLFEPAMCCATGICGVGVDSELLRISTVLESLNKKGLEIIRYNLSNAPMEFVNRPYIQSELRTHGVDILPLTVIDEQIKISSRYPTNDEIISLLGLNTNILNEPGKISLSLSTNECCCDSNCCSDGKCC